MSENETNAAPKIYATLVRGVVYIYGGKTFEANSPVEVTAAERAYLEVEAVDVLTVEDEEVLRQKFTFAVEGEATNVSGTQSRPRTRAR
jgi:hypothetical protein